jgi:hypothetical protein
MSGAKQTSRRPRRGLFLAWAGDSVWRRFLAWLAQTAIMVALVAIVAAMTMLVLLPMMTEGLTEIFRNRMR